MLLLGLAALRLTADQTLTPAQVDGLVGKALRLHAIPGASVGVMVDGKIVVAKGYGVRGLPKSQPVQSNTPFAVGSVTKQFTAACVFRLADLGKLAVTDRLSKYLPQLTSSSRITLLDLMNQVSGYPDYYPLDFIDRRLAKPISTASLVDLYGRMPLDFQPGAQWSYSNTNYIILSLVVEKVAQRPFGDFLKREFLDPLGMHDTFYAPPVRDGRFAQGTTTFMLGPIVLADREAAGWCGAAGDLHSTAADLLKWDLALMSGKVMSKTSFETFTRSRILPNGADARYACGLSPIVINGYRLLYHSGAVSGFSALNILCPANRSAFVLLVNTDLPDTGGFTLAMVSRILPKTLGPVPRTKPRQAAIHVPVSVAGDPDETVVRRLVAGLQIGSLDRGELGAEFSWYLTPERLTAASASLAPLGMPVSISIGAPSERGGLAVSSVTVKFAKVTAAGLLYRSSDGKVQEFLLSPAS